MEMDKYMMMDEPLLSQCIGVGHKDFIPPEISMGNMGSPSYINMGMMNSMQSQIGMMPSQMMGNGMMQPQMMGMGMMQPSMMGMMNSSPPISMPMENNSLPTSMGFVGCPANNSMCKNNNNICEVLPRSTNNGNEIKDIKAKINTNKQDDIMKIINTQDFINGFWEANNYTNIIKEKYKKEYDLLKGIKSKNITDRVAITFLIIYFIDKEHPELLDELLMIIKKAKIFIFKEAKDTYKNIIKEISISYIGLNY
jgi:hypothetical protein